MSDADTCDKCGSREPDPSCDACGVPETIGGWPLNMSGGEARAIRREEHLCEGCFHQGLCVVDSAVKAEMLTVISRCGAFVAVPDGT